jgi:hypothetical protein
LTIKERNTNRNYVTIARGWMQKNLGTMGTVVRGWNAEESDVSLIYQRLNKVGFIL